MIIQHYLIFSYHADGIRSPWLNKFTFGIFACACYKPIGGSSSWYLLTFERWWRRLHILLVSFRNIMIIILIFHTRVICWNPLSAEGIIMINRERGSSSSYPPDIRLPKYHDDHPVYSEEVVDIAFLKQHHHILQYHPSANIMMTNSSLCSESKIWWWRHHHSLSCPDCQDHHDLVCSPDISQSPPAENATFWEHPDDHHHHFFILIMIMVITFSLRQDFFSNMIRLAKYHDDVMFQV